MVSAIPMDGHRQLPRMRTRAGLARCAAAAMAMAVISPALAADPPPPRPKPLSVLISASIAAPQPKPDTGAATPAPAPATAAPVIAAAAPQAAAPPASAGGEARHASGPQPKPKGVSPAPWLSRAEYAAFEAAFGAAQGGDFRRGLAGASKLSDPVAKTVIEWLYLRSSSGAASGEEIAAFLLANPDWPDPEILRQRAEGWLFTKRPGARETIAYFDKFAPTTGTGMVTLAGAYRAAGDKARAEKLFLRAWREERLSDALETLIRTECGCITKKLEKERLDRMAYRRATAETLRAGKRLGAGYVELAEAHIAVAKRSRGAAKQIGQVPESLKTDPALTLSRVTWARRADRDEQARTLLLTAPRDIADILDAEAWWTERRLVARRALGDRKLARDAYRIAAAHSLTSGGSYADAEFLSGWIALRHLKDPNLALRHFANLRKAVDQPISIARAEYWLARANDALGRTSAAQEHRSAAASHGVTFYGQLARNEIHGDKSVLDLPQISESVWRGAAAIDEHPLMRAARLLAAAGERNLAARFLRRLAYRTEDAGSLDRVAKLANLLALPQVSVRIGKIGISRGAPVHDVAYPVSDFPQLSPAPDIERALLLALTRQESEFAWQASSHAGARGLMQVMPATGKMLARQAGVAFSLTKLGEDPHYNASLGSSFIADLVASFDGSYVLAIASYNAGPGRVGEWIERFGDPRSGDIDVVDWIETIPFDETRNYVQRVLENLQVYRARLKGEPVPLRLAEDLARGRTGAKRAYALD